MACCGLMMPTFSPFSLIKRISRESILSFTRGPPSRGRCSLTKGLRFMFHSPHLKAAPRQSPEIHCRLVKSLYMFKSPLKSSSQTAERALRRPNWVRSGGFAQQVEGLSRYVLNQIYRMETGEG